MSEDRAPIDNPIPQTSTAELSSAEAPSRLARLLYGDGHWRMAGFFMAASVSVSLAMAALAHIADANGAVCGLAPMLSPIYATPPITVVLGG